MRNYEQQMLHSVAKRGVIYRITDQLIEPNTPGGQVQEFEAFLVRFSTNAPGLSGG